MIDLNELKRKAYECAKKRAENGGVKPLNTFNLLKHCATEVIEATEALVFRDYAAYDESVYILETDILAAELCDIICCILIIAENERIDIEQALLKCIEKNRKRAEGIGDKR